MRRLIRQVLMLMTDAQETCTRNLRDLTCARNLYVCHADLQQDFSRASFWYKFLVRLSRALRPQTYTNALTEVSCYSAILSGRFSGGFIIVK